MRFKYRLTITHEYGTNDKSSSGEEIGRWRQYFKKNLNHPLKLSEISCVDLGDRTEPLCKSRPEMVTYRYYKIVIVFGYYTPIKTSCDIVGRIWRTLYKKSLGWPLLKKDISVEFIGETKGRKPVAQRPVTAERTSSKIKRRTS